jgi:hypothetical protein
MAAPGRVVWVGSRGRALGCQHGLGARRGLVAAGCAGSVEKHRDGGGHDRGSYGDEGDLPAGHAAHDDGLHRGRWCHGPVAAAHGRGGVREGGWGRGGGGKQGRGQGSQDAGQAADSPEGAGAVHGDLLMVAEIEVAGG